MPKGAWILIAALALAGAGAWLLLEMGPDSPLPRPNTPGAAWEEGAGTPPDPAGPGRLRRPVPGEEPAPRPEAGRSIELGAASPGWGPVAGAAILVLDEKGLILAEAETAGDGRARILVGENAPVAELAVDHPEFVPWRGAPPRSGPVEALLVRAGRIAGLVLGLDGRAAAGARVAASQGQDPVSTLSGPDGSYTLARLIPGSAELTCSFQGHVRGRATRVEAGLETRVDFDFAPTGPLVSGFLLGPGGEPKAGWWVAAEASEAGFRASGRVQEDGTFQLQLPGPARIELLAGPADQPTGPWNHCGSREVSSQGLAGLRLVLGGVELQGRLVLEEGGALPEGCPIRAWLEEEEGMRLAGSTARLSPEGSFRLAGLPAGTYRLEIRPPGLPTSIFWLGALADGAHDAGTLRLTRLGLGELRILCQGQGGPPPETFRLWRREGDLWLPLDPTPLGKHAYLVPALPAGDQEFRVEAEGFVPGELQATIPPGAAFRLTLEFLRGHPVTLELRAPAGTALLNVHARLAAGGPAIEARPVGPGLWLFPALPAGRITLLIAAPGFLPTPVVLDVPAGSVPAATVDMRLR